jgi:valyl-tRNA synthetase
LCSTKVAYLIQGLPRFDARWRVLSALREQALFEGKREHPMVVPICSRSGDVIEPLIKPQWFLSTAEMEQKALEASECEELRFTPALHHKVWKSWLGNDR